MHVGYEQTEMVIAESNRHCCCRFEGIYPYELPLYRVGSIEIAIKKAKAAVFFGMNTGQNGSSVENNHPVAKAGVEVIGGLADLPSHPRRT